MATTFRPVDRSTPYILPQSIEDWLPEDHLARFVVEVVSKLDLGPLRASYAGRGSTPYDPGMLLSLIFYGYATGNGLQAGAIGGEEVEKTQRL